jgi:hypothetical protein
MEKVLHNIEQRSWLAIHGNITVSVCGQRLSLSSRLSQSQSSAAFPMCKQWAYCDITNWGHAYQ